MVDKKLMISDLFMKTTCFILLLCCFYNLQGQTNFLPGYVINNDNDTLQGLIDYRGDARNSKRCEFKENENAPAREFFPFSIKGYRFTGSKFYVSKNVTIDGKEVSLFLEFLVNGISDLYYYSEGENSHYFIEKADGQIYELTNEARQFYRDGNDFSTNSKRYVGLLKLAFADCKQIYPMIDRTKFDDKSLIAITKKYHDYVCDDEKCIIYEKQLPVIKVKFGSFVSMNGSFLKFKENQIYQDVDFKMASYPTIGLLLNTSLPKVSEKLSFQVSGEYGKSYFYGTGNRPDNSAFEEVHLHTSIIMVKAGFKYTYPKGKIRPTILAGGNFMKLTKIDGRRIEEELINSTVYTTEWRDVPVDDMLFGANVNIGIDYHHTSALVSFLKLGYESSFTNNEIVLSPTASPITSPLTSTIINTINLHAGIYF